jgi:hypothetical protein
MSSLDPNTLQDFQRLPARRTLTPLSELKHSEVVKLEVGVRSAMSGIDAFDPSGIRQACLGAVFSYGGEPQILGHVVATPRTNLTLLAADLTSCIDGSDVIIAGKYDPICNAVDLAYVQVNGREYYQGQLVHFR